MHAAAARNPSSGKVAFLWTSALTRIYDLLP
jgi:hypothetical protein